MIKNFIKNVKGVAALEFSLLAPIFITLMIGVVETSNWLYITQKMENAANNILNIMNQEEQLSNANLTTIVGIVPEIAKPVALTDSMFGVVITSIQSDRPIPERLPDPYVFWQEKFKNSSLVTSQFKYTKGGSNATVNKLPPGSLRGFNFIPGDQVIVVEIAIKYTPLITSGLLPAFNTDLKYFAFSRPRKGAFSFRPDDLD